ncbi:MAG: LysM peptidoglycan-binding domain-containing protein [Bacteroidetes bacterium]|nr:LysM peptidoglycan-binding domain-containing protein [Bacteroidota bacterium]
MNCPVCNFSALQEGSSTCPQCNSNLDAYSHISKLDTQAGNHRKAIWILSILLLVLVIASGFAYFETDEDSEHAKPENAQVNSPALTGKSPVTGADDVKVKLENQVKELNVKVSEKDNMIMDLQAKLREAEANKSASVKYTISEGESLWIIAENELGDGFAYTRIACENNISNPDVILTGKEIRITKTQ